jgi:hypothetical protein
MKLSSFFTITTALTLAAFLTAGLTTGCASLNSVSVTPIPAQRKNIVQSQHSKLIFLAFNFDNDFVDDVVTDLKQQCPNGKVTGLLTKDENINYFLYFVWRKQITATGYCVPHGTSTAAVSMNEGSDFPNKTPAATDPGKNSKDKKKKRKTASTQEADSGAAL